MAKPKRNSKGPVVNVRYDSDAQLNRFKAAAFMCRWSLNSFMLVAGERLAKQVQQDSIDLAARYREEKP